MNFETLYDAVQHVCFQYDTCSAKDGCPLKRDGKYYCNASFRDEENLVDGLIIILEELGYNVKDYSEVNIIISEDDISSVFNE